MTTKDRPLRRQGEATKAKLLDAALTVLSDKGFHAARVDDVVTTAGVSHGTFYLYFANKEELFRALAEACADEAVELAAALPEISPEPEGREVLRAWLADYLDFYRRHGVVIRGWVENQFADHNLARLGTKSFRRITATVHRSISGDKQTSRSVELRATALLAMVERFTYTITSRDLGWTDEQVLDTLATLAHRGWFRLAT
ncbi:MAG: TetR/AcrR family transcriptional regulator [Acidimicrobiia bacterium]|nr:TetR/AcrR family transcriptional regulator [Acidimicrobiia bacterium]